MMNIAISHLLKSASENVPGHGSEPVMIIGKAEHAAVECKGMRP